MTEARRTDIERMNPSWRRVFSPVPHLRRGDVGERAYLRTKRSAGVIAPMTSPR